MRQLSISAFRRCSHSMIGVSMSVAAHEGEVVNSVLTHVENIPKRGKRRKRPSREAMWIRYPIVHRPHRHAAMALRRRTCSALLMPPPDARGRDQPARAGLRRIERPSLEMLTGPTSPIAFLEPVRGGTPGVPAVVWELVDAAPRTTRVPSIARRVATAPAVTREDLARPVKPCRLARRHPSTSITRTGHRRPPALLAARSGLLLLEHSCRFPAG